jgi:histidinol phosphatase-like enzyme
MLLELMRELGTEPDRTLMIGDTTHDLQLAANAGTPSIAVSYGAHDHAEWAGDKDAENGPLVGARRKYHWTNETAKKAKSSHEKSTERDRTS